MTQTWNTDLGPLTTEQVRMDEVQVHDRVVRWLSDDYPAVVYEVVTVDHQPESSSVSARRLTKPSAGHQEVFFTYHGSQPINRVVG